MEHFSGLKSVSINASFVRNPKFADFYWHGKLFKMLVEPSSHKATPVTCLDCSKTPWVSPGSTNISDIFGTMSVNPKWRDIQEVIIPCMLLLIDQLVGYMFELN